MKINMIKQPGGVLIPANDLESERFTRFKTGELYPIEIKLSRNPAFLRKTFAFFDFCFQYWKGDKEFLNERAQFEHFRSELTIVAGYSEQVFDLSGEGFTLKAKSISFGSMEEEEFSECYNALIQAAITNIFKGDETVYGKLYSFF